MSGACHVETTMAIERDGVEMELTVKGNVTPIRPATMRDPEEGGEIEIESVVDEQGNEVELTDAEESKAQEAIYEALPEPDED